MKKIVTYGLTALLGLGLSGNSLAAIITSGSFDGTNVGSVDLFLVATNSLPNSGDAAELAWVKGFLNDDDTEYLIKTDEVSYFSTNELNVFAFKLAQEPTHYIIKNSTFWALFENVASLDWGVFNASSLPNGMNLPDEEFEISHVTEFKSTDGVPPIGNPVPEPGMIALLGTGLLGFSLTQLRKRKKA